MGVRGGQRARSAITFANERTFLVDRHGARADGGRRRVEALGVPMLPGLRLAASLLLLGLGVAVPALAWTGWGSRERAVRRGEPLPSSWVAPLLVVGTAAVGLFVLLGLVLR